MITHRVKSRKTHFNPTTTTVTTVQFEDKQNRIPSETDTSFHTSQHHDIMLLTDCLSLPVTNTINIDML